MVARYLLMTSFLATSALEIVLLELHNPVGFVLILPWVYLVIKLARNSQ